MDDVNLEKRTLDEKDIHQLAQQHKQISSGDFPPYILRRLPDQKAKLEFIHRFVLNNPEKKVSQSTPAEWLLDNFYIVKQALSQIEQDLPESFYKELPKLNERNEAAGLPRVYALARAFIIKFDCQVEIKRLMEFLAEYQETNPLRMGELWALPIMLRFALIECLVQTAGNLIDLKENDLLPAFAFDILAKNESNVATSIMSLRRIAGQDWQTFFEEVSPIEKILRRDPARLYERMTFNTRDKYRKIIETLAQGLSLTESEVALRVIDLALSESTDPPSNGGKWTGLNYATSTHIGYYLIGPGRKILNQNLGYQESRLGNWVRSNALYLYLGSIFLITSFFLGLLFLYTYRVGGEWWQLLLISLLGFIPLSSATIGILNWLITLLVKPRTLPKLDFSKGVPGSCRTMVVVPALLSHRSEVQSLFSQLEQHYLRNSDPNLGFALLTDFSDAQEPRREEDEALIEDAKNRLKELNGRYPSSPFYLFHRRRLFNPGEGTWMGWERKRGKLHEFNRLLRGADDTSYNVQEGKLSFLSRVKYVITLDADTVLPAGAAQKLIGTLAHPLNRADWDQRTGRVKNGYTILQPRVEIKPTVAEYSLFTRVFAGDTGIDLYSRAVSDIYQDLFAEGIFVGKGIYDVDAFERSVKGRIIENALLSHDLFEGIQGRAALVTDIVMYEDYPLHYLVQVRRSHRWIRGDWQLLPWLGSRVPTVEGKQPNDLPLLSRWKIIDNLRRSLDEPFLFLFFIVGWLLLPGSAAVWTLLGLLISAVPLLTPSLSGFFRSISIGGSLREMIHPVRDSLIRWLLKIAFLPYESLLHLDAISITLWRLFVNHKNLLQWTTAAHTARLLDKEDSAEKTAGKMIRPLILVTFLLILQVLWRPQSLIAAVPLMIIWVLASEIAYRISKPDSSVVAALSKSEQQRLRTLARRTWLFFESFVGPEDNWLPPDHYQESPRGIVAHRTSPTNIGLYLLSTLAAYDLGYISSLNLSLRLHDTFETLDKLERYRGHFVNWIDTRTLKSLSPRYVSTVDSGNLAGCLIALKQGCLSIKNQPAFRPQRWSGLNDTLNILIESVALLPKDGDEFPIIEQLQLMQSKIEEGADETQSWINILDQLKNKDLPELENRLLSLFAEEERKYKAENIYQWRLYRKRLQENLDGMIRELTLFYPWVIELLDPPPYLTSNNLPESVVEHWQLVKNTLPINPRLSELVEITKKGEQALNQLQEAIQSSGNASQTAEVTTWCAALKINLIKVRLTVEPLLASFDYLAERSQRFVNEMDFSFLLDNQKQVFHIGLNLESGHLDNNYYDLLASEARIASLVAIAKGDVPQKHWLHLSRPLTRLNGGVSLLSWSGTMFEYLMPNLLMKSFKGTLLSQTTRTAVNHQIAYGSRQGLPWGISESGYYAFDNAQNYQYAAFGVPGAGFKRGLGENRVIAPYASMMALPYRPDVVMRNFESLLDYQMMGIYGFYEALDFTETRLNFGQKAGVVHSYMAHHQGMILVTLDNYLMDNIIVKRFHAEPTVKSVELLLQEKLPYNGNLVEIQEKKLTEETPLKHDLIHATPWDVPSEAVLPLVHYLSNGQFHSMFTNSGAGYLSYKGLQLTRWRPDSTCDNWGLWIYVQDLRSRNLWSLGVQPVSKGKDNYDVHYYPHKVQINREDFEINLQLEVTVAANANVEIRRVQLTNNSSEERYLRLSSFGEVVLTDFGSDDRHPAFAKLFVESKYENQFNALIYRRRPRSKNERPCYLGHMLVMASDLTLTRSYESDRAKFLGRNNNLAQPEAFLRDKDLTKTTGATLDPIMALAQDVELTAHESIELAWVTFAAETSDELEALAESFSSWSAIEHAFQHSLNEAEQELRHLNLTVSELAQAQYLLSSLLYPHSALRIKPAILKSNTQGQPSLWGYGISGDYPILVVRLDNESGGDLLIFLLKAHAYWRRRGLKIDLIILNEQESNYGQPVQGTIFSTIQRLKSENWLNKRGGIFVLRVDQMSDSDFKLILTAGRVVIGSGMDSLDHKIAALEHRPSNLPTFLPEMQPQPLLETMSPLTRPDTLQFDNGIGGFTEDGKEFVIYLEKNQSTPAPWINVIANSQFGFLASESGGGYSWAINSGENRLTTWRNDPVFDLPAEALYLRDEETGEIWSPTPQPAPSDNPYLIRHGAGYTLFEHHSHFLKQRLCLFAAVEDPLKLINLHLENMTDRPRRITATYYAEWVLGSSRTVSQPYIISNFDGEHHALLARNPYNVEFGEREAFLAADREVHGFTADRTEFLGYLGSIDQPEALKRIGLSDSTAVGSDPAAVLQIHIDLKPGAKEDIYFYLGQGRGRADAVSLIEKYQDKKNCDEAWQALQKLWDQILGTLTVETPDQAMNLMLNRWLLYQTLSCRIWSRSALYQSSGAYGFRDQLQDVMALFHARPDLAREHIFRAARHQFEAGDVLHWWHSPSGRGVRTRITDDLVWLPFVTAEYIKTTDDASILDEKIAFLKGEALSLLEEERYSHFQNTQSTDTLYEHCCRALEKARTEGRHNLPLIGAGDWNDGMNRVGIEGNGESIWLGWFLAAALRKFSNLCFDRGDMDRAETYRQWAENYRLAIEQYGWDGEWYRRAYYDDGTPLGSQENEECRLDAIAQSWAVLSGLGDNNRVLKAMNAVQRHLINENEHLMLLFAPPFDKSKKDPGYIKGYLPGIRENGGQYTHAALWTIWAYASLGQEDKAFHLFQLINPVYRADSRQKAEHYKVEPYVVAADVYGVEPHQGRGGWTWYTGSSGWMYRLGIEGILGFRRQGNILKMEPHFPEQWPGYQMTYLYGNHRYEIEVRRMGRGHNVTQIVMNGIPLPAKEIALIADEGTHRVQVFVGSQTH